MKLNLLITSLLLVAVASLTGCPEKNAGSTALDTEASFRAEFEKLLTAAKGQGDVNFDALAKDLVVPEYQTWFKAKFGDALGAQIAESYSPMASNISRLGMALKKQFDDGKTELRIRRIENPGSDLANGYQAAAMRQMKEPITLYSAVLVEPGKDSGWSLWSFALVDGQFRYLGKMPETMPDGNPLDQLPQGDLKKLGMR